MALLLLLFIPNHPLVAYEMPTDTKSTAASIKFDHYEGINKTIASSPSITQGKTSYKLVGVFNNKGELYDQHLHVTSLFSDWAYLNKGLSYGQHLNVTKIKKEFTCKVNPCVYSETITVHFENFEKLKEESTKPGVWRFELIGANTKKQYTVPRSYLRTFVSSIEANKDLIRQRATLKAAMEK